MSLSTSDRAYTSATAYRSARGSASERPLPLLLVALSVC